MDCLDCVRKHLAQASILLDETALGYPHHRWLAAGNMAEAERECRHNYPTLAREIRAERLKVMRSHAEAVTVDLELLIRNVCRLAGEDDLEKHEDPGNSKTFEPPEVTVSSDNNLEPLTLTELISNLRGEP